MPAPIRVAFVCSGNICRSPTAEVVLATLAERAGVADTVAVDSFGTGAWHVGQDMDPRSRETLVRAGYASPRHRARQFDADDFADHDVVVALDSGHLHELQRLAGAADDPEHARGSLTLLRAYDPDLRPGDDPDVGDPYYGGPSGFDDVLAQIERSCAVLLDEITDRAGHAGHAGVHDQQTASPPL